MSSNPQIDKARENERRERILRVSLKLFAEHGIEGVSMVQIVRAAGVSEPTIYNYYGNKVNLVIAVSAAAWGKVWESAMNAKNGARMFTNAYESVEFYTNAIIKLYHEYPELLRFSSNYKTYLHREGVNNEQIRPQNDALAPMEENFFRLYEKAKNDHSIRTDIPAEEMFSTIVHTMLSMAERYAMGLVWANNHTEDHTNELLHIKEMLLNWCKGSEQ